MKVKSFSSSLPLPSMVFSTVRPPTLWVLVKVAAAVAPVAMLPEAFPEVVAVSYTHLAAGMEEVLHAAALALLS